MALSRSSHTKDVAKESQEALSLDDESRTALQDVFQVCVRLRMPDCSFFFRSLIMTLPYALIRLRGPQSPLARNAAGVAGDCIATGTKTSPLPILLRLSECRRPSIPRTPSYSRATQASTHGFHLQSEFPHDLQCRTACRQKRSRQSHEGQRRTP